METLEKSCKICSQLTENTPERVCSGKLGHLSICPSIYLSLSLSLSLFLSLSLSHSLYIYILHIFGLFIISSQPYQTIVYSESLRARRLCSLESDFLKHCTKMKPWSLKACVRYFLSNFYFFTK